MAKIKGSADTVLSILQGIMNSEDINYEITDKSAPVEWQGKKMQDILNVEYYTFRHRPMDTEIIIRDLMNQGLETNSLYSLTRSFCILSLVGVERVFSKDNDIVTVSASLEYWLQADKVKLLEDLVEDMTVETTGIRIPVQIGKEERQALIVFSNVDVTEIQDASEFGEMAICDLQVDVVLYPNVVSKSDYTAEFMVTEGEKSKWENFRFSTITFSTSMTQKAVPFINNAGDTSNINLNKVKSIVFTFNGYYDNIFTEQLVDNAMKNDVPEEQVSQNSNNDSIALRLTRAGKEYIFDCIVKEHSILVEDGPGNETHSLTLVKRGI